VDIVVTAARLIGGPHHGREDAIAHPAPDAIYWGWCRACRREHAHHAGIEPWPEHVYLRDLQASHPALHIYRHLDVDQALDDLAFLTQLQHAA
jgi:hypothetical protein